MIQFNLLPDVKIEYMKTRRRKRLIMFIAAIASAVTFAIFVLLFLFVRVNQAKYIRDLDKDIKSNVSKIQQTADLDKILTIQNQLNSLPALHDKKAFSSRMVDYLKQVTPSQATISDVDVDFESNTMVIKGNSDSLSTINKFADTLKFTDYKVNGDSILGGDKEGRAFSNVVLKSFDVSVNSDTKKQVIAYELSFTFQPAIFALVQDDTTNGGNPVELKVPQIISTRSETEKPADLFAPQPEQKPQGQGN